MQKKEIMLRITTFILLIGMTLNLNAQTQEDPETFKNQLAELDSAMTKGESLLPLASQIAVTASTDENNWLPYYYAAYCYVMEAFKSNSAITDSLLDQSDIYINKADSLCEGSNEGEKSEIYCIKSLISSARITVDPAGRGMKYGMESSERISKAKTLNSDNPRVYLIEAQSLMYTPEAYGGGCENAKPVLETALKKYQKFKSKNDLQPSWGKSDVEELLEQCAD